jgi:hypothetical protein
MTLERYLTEGWHIWIVRNFIHLDNLVSCNTYILPVVRDGKFINMGVRVGNLSCGHACLHVPKLDGVVVASSG